MPAAALGLRLEKWEVAMRSGRLGLSWLKALLGCGCALGLVALLVVGVGGFFAYRQASQTFMLDPARVQALAERESPGSKAPAGFTGAFGMDMARVQMAFYRGSGERLLGLVAVPYEKEEKISHEQLIAQLEGAMSSSNQKRGGDKKVLEHREYAARSGGKQLAGVRRLVEESGERKWEYCVFGKSPSRDKTILVIFASSPEKDKNDGFVQEYLKTVKMLPYGE